MTKALKQTLQMLANDPSASENERELAKQRLAKLQDDAIVQHVHTDYAKQNLHTSVPIASIASDIVHIVEKYGCVLLVSEDATCICGPTVQACKLAKDLSVLCTLSDEAKLVSAMLQHYANSSEQSQLSLPTDGVLNWLGNVQMQCVGNPKDAGVRAKQKATKLMSQVDKVHNL